MYKIGVYVPESHLESVKEALFSAGAGQIGAYQACSWQTEGQGQFLPKEDAQPFLGRVGDSTRVSEFRVELICAKEHLKAAIDVLKKAHPYETPAYDVVALVEV